MTPTPSSAARQPLHGRRAHLLALLGFVGVSLLIFLPADLHATSVMVGATTADNSQHVWFLRWLPHALATHQNPLFTTDLVAPGGVNLMWNTWLPLPALLLSPITLLAGPVASFDIAITLGAALSGWCAYLVAARWLRRRSAALFAGAAYGFSPFIFDQAYTGHSNMVIAVVPALLLLVLDSALVRGASPRRAGLLLGALMITQLFITEELLASEAVMVVAGIAWGLLIFPHRLAAHRRAMLTSLGWAMALFVPVAAYPLWFQFLGPQVPHQLLADKNFFVTDLLNVFLPSTAQGVEPGFARAIANHYSGNSGEWGGYVGLPMLAVVGWTAWTQWRRRLVRLLCALAATALVLSLGSTLHVGGVDTHVPLPAAILAHLPVLDNLVPARFALYVALFTALLLGFFVDSLPRHRQGRRVALVTAVLIAASFAPPLPFPTRAAVTPAYFTTSRSPLRPGAVVLVVPFSHDFYSTQAVLWQAESGIAFAMPEGYVINRQPSGAAGQGPPPSATSVTLAAIAAGSATDASVDAPTRSRVLDELHAWGVSTVVLGPMDHGAEMRAFLTDLLGAAPADRDGVAVWSTVPART